MTSEPSKGNTYDAKEQVAEMVKYCRYRKDYKGDATPPDQLCRFWIRKYAGTWRNLKQNGVDNPSEALMPQYLSETTLLRPAFKLQRYKTLAEKLASI